MTASLQVYAGPRARPHLRERGQAAGDVRGVPAAAGGQKGLVLYPHLQAAVVAGWFDKGLKHRHAATAGLSNVVLLSPHPDWVKAALPNAKLPDRGDFKAYGDDLAGRQ